MKDLMLDIETLGLRSTSVITQIGACYFDRKTGDYGSNFLMNIDVGDCINRGLTIDWSTVKWWMSKTVDGKADWMENAGSLEIVMGALAEFVKNADYIWSHSTFDIPIIANAYYAIGGKLPFHYRATRDIRTLTHLAGHQRNEKETFNKKHDDDKSHNALDDCIYQVEYCVECFNKLKEK